MKKPGGTIGYNIDQSQFTPTHIMFPGPGPSSARTKRFARSFILMPNCQIDNSQARLATFVRSPQSIEQSKCKYAHASLALASSSVEAFLGVPKNHAARSTNFNLKEGPPNASGTIVRILSRDDLVKGLDERYRGTKLRNLVIMKELRKFINKLDFQLNAKFE